jgi:4-amino-4-deoxy-L-arabinose transferase-like glycosyltransferase
MSTSTAITSTKSDPAPRKRHPRRETVLTWGFLGVLFIIAIGMRLYGLGLRFDRDGYDEGVYWQSLLAMHSGHALYQQIFYSQPPFFLLTLFPGFMLFGGTLWSARFTIALISLFGLLGIALLGKALSGRVGAIICLLLLVVDPYFLRESQTIQAEASCIAFSILAVGLAYLWWEQPEGLTGLCWAALTGIALSLSILCKLLGVVSIAPIALLILARLWQIWQKQPQTSLASLRPILVGIAACIVTMLLVLLPFLGSYQTMLQEVIGYHLQPTSFYSRSMNTSMIGSVIISFLGIAAFYGTLVAFLRRDWRVIPLLAWLLATAFFLWRLLPLLPHHLVALTPPLIGLAVIGIGKDPITDLNKLLGAFVESGKSTEDSLRLLVTPLAILLILFTTAFSILQDVSYYQTMNTTSMNASNQLQRHVAVDLQRAITPGQLVVTDAQFIAGLAQRSTPPNLVDTSTVRITDQSLTLQQLIAEASQPQVHAVLFFTGRLYLPELAGFHSWVAQHFHLLHTYGPRQELWVR